MFLFYYKQFTENIDENTDSNRKRRRILGPEFGSIDFESEEVKKILAARSKHVGAVREVISTEYHPCFLQILPLPLPLNFLVVPLFKESHWAFSQVTHILTCPSFACRFETSLAVLNCRFQRRLVVGYYSHPSIHVSRVLLFCVMIGACVCS